MSHEKSWTRTALLTGAAFATVFLAAFAARAAAEPMKRDEIATVFILL